MRTLPAAALLCACTSALPGETALVSACGPVALAVDSNNLYWTSKCDGGSLQVASKSDWSFTSVVNQLGEVGDLVLDGDTVYIAVQAQLLKVATTGGAANVVATGTAPVAVVADDQNLYWSDTAGYIYSMPKDGHLSPSRVGPGGFLSKQTIDSSYLYWTYDTCVWRQAKGSTTSEFIVCDQSGGYERTMATLEGHVFLWSTTFPGNTGMIDGALETLYEGSNVAESYFGDNYHSALSDQQYVYWFKDLQLVRRPLGGGADEAVANVSSFDSVGEYANVRVDDVVMDDEYLYWADDTTGAILRAHK